MSVTILFYFYIKSTLVYVKIEKVNWPNFDYYYK